MEDLEATYEKWFKLADQDKDGRVGGQEAVVFFQRSGLSNEVLGKIWGLVHKGQPSLDAGMFAKALSLISLAQSNNNVLDENAAKFVVAGLRQVPPPRLTGLELTSSVPQQPRDGLATLDPLGSGAAAPSAATQPAATSSGVVDTSAAATAGVSDAETPSLPLMTSADKAKHERLFDELDSGKTGAISNMLCASAFTQWNVSRDACRDIWNLVAGDAAQLTKEQFVACAYLLDLVKAGHAVPKQLPPGPFPPEAGTAVPALAATPQLGLAAMPPTAPPLPETPQLPARSAPKLPARPPYNEARLPRITPQLLEVVPASDAERVRNQHASATQLDARLFEVEWKTKEVAAIGEALQNDAQQLVFLRRRTLTQISDLEDETKHVEKQTEEVQLKAQKLERELEAITKDVDSWQSKLAVAKQAQSEWQAKVAAVTAEVDTAARTTPEEKQRLDAEVAALKKQLEVVRGQHAHMRMQLASLNMQRDLLSARAAANAPGADMHDFTTPDTSPAVQALRAELAQLAEKVDEAETNDALRYQLRSTMTQCASLFRRLLKEAQNNNIQPAADLQPLVGLANPNAPQVSMREAAKQKQAEVDSALEWTQFDNEQYTFVNFLPILPPEVHAPMEALEVPMFKSFITPEFEEEPDVIEEAPAKIARMDSLDSAQTTATVEVANEAQAQPSVDVNEAATMSQEASPFDEIMSPRSSGFEREGSLRPRPSLDKQESGVRNLDTPVIRHSRNISKQSSGDDWAVVSTAKPGRGGLFGVFDEIFPTPPPGSSGGRKAPTFVVADPFGDEDKDNGRGDESVPKAKSHRRTASGFVDDFWT